MNLLEKEFLNVIDWRLMVTAPVMQHYYTSLVHMHPNYTLAPATGPLPTAFPAVSGTSRNL
ncbi:pho80-cyclin [Malassezia pachydermatis]|uniref:Pho80-cyclin n=1 Tax=Malassezia pachydermatis TaxID=77020 RepID=A0A0M9VNZ0_9BASI|nr:pho80-cyclin [Malassezia pachydermatis]KOS13825.1 pho80-cyclin [Malassezia pachydermatis]